MSTTLLAIEFSKIKHPPTFYVYELERQQDQQTAAAESSVLHTKIDVLEHFAPQSLFIITRKHRRTDRPTWQQKPHGLDGWWMTVYVTSQVTQLKNTRDTRNLSKYLNLIPIKNDESFRLLSKSIVLKLFVYDLDSATRRRRTPVAKSWLSTNSDRHITEPFATLGVS